MLLLLPRPRLMLQRRLLSGRQVVVVVQPVAPAGLDVRGVVVVVLVVYPLGSDYGKVSE